MFWKWSLHGESGLSPRQWALPAMRDRLLAKTMDMLETRLTHFKANVYKDHTGTPSSQQQPFILIVYPTFIWQIQGDKGGGMIRRTTSNQVVVTPLLVVLLIISPSPWLSNPNMKVIFLFTQHNHNKNKKNNNPQ